MTPEPEKLINTAITALRLRDIILYDSRLFREEGIPNRENFEAQQQHKRGIRYGIQDSTHDGTSGQVLSVFVSLGTRLVESPPRDQTKVYFGVEATYLVIYELVSPLSEEALKAFADFNVVHNVWPFWRQHVFDLIGQGRLPELQIPLFAGVTS